MSPALKSMQPKAIPEIMFPGATSLLRHALELRSQGKKAFVPYLVAGFPEKKWTIPLMLAAARAGAAAIELGVPFSDPIADGPILQEANHDALQGGMSLDDVLDIVYRASREISIPIVLMGYTNPFLRKGWETLSEEASLSGVKGLIIADLPVEESSSIVEILRSRDVGLTLLCSPTTEKRRIKLIEKQCTGFLYLLTTKGVTGPRDTLPADLFPFLEQVKSMTSKPVYAGFGLSHPDQAKALVSKADGVILGSCIASFLREEHASPDLDRKLENFLTPWIKEIQPGT